MRGLRWLGATAVMLALLLSVAGVAEALWPDIPAEPPESATAALRLNACAVSLGEGESFQLEWALIGADGGAAVSFASSQSSVAKVDGAGRITAVKKGGARITAAAATGLTAECAVTVGKAPGWLKLNAGEVKLGYDAALGVGTQFQLAPVLPKGSFSRIRYGGYDRAVAEVTADGRIVARGVGSTKITARTFNRKKATVTVKVLPGPEAIALGEDALSMIPGERAVLAARLPEGTAGTVSFASSDAGVAAVNPATGEITARGLGEAVVTAASFNGRTARCAVRVLEAPVRVKLGASKLTLGEGESADLRAAPVGRDGSPAGGALKYSSSRESVAKVDGAGRITAVKKGSARITATAPNGVKAACKVTVLAAPSSVTLLAKRPRLVFDANTGRGETTALTATLPKKSTSAITYSGYDPAILRVTADGRAMAVGLGVTAVTAETFNGKRAQCVIAVRAPGRARTVNVAHRGGMAYWPENTLEAFRHAESTGATAVALDARTTEDGVQVIHHDAGFTLGGKRYTIEEVPLERLRRLRPDICTLDEAIEVIAGTGLELILEMKATADPGACVEAVRRFNMQGRTVYISFDAPLLRRVRRLDPQARLGYLINRVPPNLSSLVGELKLEALLQRENYMTGANLVRWQCQGLQVGVWTINDPIAIQKWLDLGVDYITSDYPRMVADALD